jgi:hypothetical protein
VPGLVGGTPSRRTLTRATILVNWPPINCAQPSGRTISPGVSQMRRFLSYLAIPLLLACDPTDGAFARGGGGGHGSGSYSSGASRGPGYVNPSYHYTRGYFHRDGTYVHGYYATNPNGTKLDNYSTIGNVNPWTGKPGWIRPDETSRAHPHVRSDVLPEVPMWSTESSPSVPTSRSATVSRQSATVSPAPDERETSFFPATGSNGYHPHWTVNAN